MLATRTIEASILFVIYFAIFNGAVAVQSSEFFVKRERQSKSPIGSEKSEFNYYLRLPREDLQGTASTHYGHYYSGPQDQSNHRGANVRRGDPFSSGSYGLAFVAPSSYGYGSQGAYGNNPGYNQYYNGAMTSSPPVNGISIASLGPGRYAFPIFDYAHGFGGFGGLGYVGQNLGFAYPGYGLGNKIFGEGIYPMRHI